MEGPQSKEKSFGAETSNRVHFGSPNNGLEERAANILHSPSSSQSSQQANKKRSFLDIVNNPTTKRDGPEQKQKKESPNLTISSFGDNHRAFQGIQNRTIPIEAQVLEADSAFWIEKTSFGSQTDMSEQNLYSNIGGSIAPFFKMAQSSSPNLPPLGSIKSPVPSLSSTHSLPSLSALFGKNLLNNSHGRYVHSTANSKENPSSSSTAPYMLPNINDSYNPLNASLTQSHAFHPPPFIKEPQQNHQFQNQQHLQLQNQLQNQQHHHLQQQHLQQQQQRPQSHQQQQPTSRSLTNEGQSTLPSSPSGSVRFPLSDRATSLNNGAEQNNRFILLEQPNEIQRKSYKNESRYLLPNPLTICLRSPIGSESLPAILDGSVNVKIINADGNELPVSMQNILESLGGLTRPLDEERSASFSLKVSATSIGSMYRLVFTITYRAKGAGSFTESILSNPFSVCSNRKKQLKELKERLNQLQRKN